MRPEIQRARQFRRQMSDAEVILWSRLRRLRQRGFHVRRQAPFRGYYLDFVCFARRLVVEVDGSQHNENIQSEHDFVRDRVLARQGFAVLRFSAGEVRRNSVGVMDRIIAELEARPDTRSKELSSCEAEPSRGGPTLARSREPVPPH